MTVTVTFRNHACIGRQLQLVNTLRHDAISHMYPGKNLHALTVVSS